MQETTSAAESETQTDGDQADAGQDGAPGADADAGQDSQAETQSAEDGGNTEKTDGDDKQPKADPEPFELNIDLPKDVEVDEARLGGFKETITDFEGALADAAGDRGKIRELVSGMANKLVSAEASAIEAATQSHVQQVDGWKEACRKDAEFGGAKFDENMGAVAMVRDRFGSEGFQELMDETGFGSHPEVVRFLFNASKAISESDPTGGGAGGPAQNQSKAEILFG